MFRVRTPMILFVCEKSFPCTKNKKIKKKEEEELYLRAKLFGRETKPYLDNN